jgi:cell division septum initiation protein DivIVA
MAKRLTDYEKVKKLQEENEKLRKQNERLSDRLKKVTSVIESVDQRLLAMDSSTHVPISLKEWRKMFTLSSK